MTMTTRTMSNRGEKRLLEKRGKKLSRKWVAQVLDILEESWGMEANPHFVSTEDPLDGLILTVLSQNTNDRNRDAAFLRLKQRFPSWKEVHEAPTENLEEAIRPAGLGPTKAKRITHLLSLTLEAFGDFSLSSLREWDPGKARAYLEALPGVGAKTAACVLVFDLDMPAFPVDTHIARLCTRIGFVLPGTTPEDISRIMEQYVPKERYRGAHLNFIEHGRHVCGARKPACEGCPLRLLCNTGKGGGFSRD